MMQPAGFQHSEVSSRRESRPISVVSTLVHLLFVVKEEVVVGGDPQLSVVVGLHKMKLLNTHLNSLICVLCGSLLPPLCDVGSSQN